MTTPYVSGQVLTADELNASLAAKTDAATLASNAGAGQVGTSTGATVEARITAVESANNSNATSISSEVTRATNAEATINTTLSGHTSAIAANSTAISAEQTRATNAENTLNTSLTNLSNTVTAMNSLTYEPFTAAHTLASTDANDVLQNAGASLALTIPLSTSTPAPNLPLKTPFVLRGKWAVTGASGVTINSTGTTTNTNSWAFLIQESTDVWSLAGDVT